MAKWRKKMYMYCLVSLCLIWPSRPEPSRRRSVHGAEMGDVSEESLLDYFCSAAGSSGRVRNADILRTFKPFIGHAEPQLRGKLPRHHRGQQPLKKEGRARASGRAGGGRETWRARAVSLSAGLKCGDGTAGMTSCLFSDWMWLQSVFLVKSSVPPCALTNTLNVPSLFSAVNRRTSGLR